MTMKEAAEQAITLVYREQYKNDDAYLERLYLVARDLYDGVDLSKWNDRVNIGVPCSSKPHREGFGGDMKMLLLAAVRNNGGSMRISC